MKFTQIPTDTFKEVQLNAGVLLSNFNPTTATLSNTDIVGATSGGVSFSDVPQYMDLGEDIDNCPKNTKELKRIDTREIKLSGTFISLNAERAKTLIASADVSASSADTPTKVTIRNDLKPTDFIDLWWVGDYSDQNGAKNGGFIAIHIMNALSTGGFSLQTADKEKGQIPFEYTAHYSIESVDTVPYEVYIMQGKAEA